MKGMTRRNFVKMAGIAMATAAAGSLWQDKTSLAETADAPAAPKAARLSYILRGIFLRPACSRRTMPLRRI